MNPKERKAAITRMLNEAFEPETLGVEDESYMHEGHEGAKDGRSHFRVLIISTAFDGKSLLERHRMVYKALGNMMRIDIHALAIDAWTPDELDR
jgi:BolA protein